MKKTLTIITILATLFIGTLAYAQSDNSMFVRSSPEAPGAFEETTLSLVSYSFNLDTSEISWTLDGKLALSGAGKKSFTFTTKGVGSASTVNIKIITSGGEEIDRRVTIRPANVDLLWQATDSYVPPFYKGKVMPASETKFKVVAFSDIRTSSGTRPPNSSLNFTWKRNYEPVSGTNGLGRNSLSFKNSYMDEEEPVSVMVSTLDGGGAGQRQITLKMFNPEIIFYERHPLDGLRWHTALNNGFSLSSDETTIVAEPYFFTENDLENEKFKISWQMNNQSLQVDKKWELTVRPGASGGQATLKVVMNNLVKLFQSAESAVRIRF
ncbi:hypothetical protein A3I25_02320 [Candidatus Nomurabacteria bacterium RIFCSPLOWO2_02_FULL_42_17]|uniref:Uncharacterized protein n=1 Tax=Candidatus Nomurabacteria bacterium RIFCSPLOWO2_02_FULL_42_17 TaxID=1801789 RepID=A0A1F6XT05_9BACT|nr:MAG: hypothetical protein A3I25_02320 [Candidatus Nomurabacteria bacterium RIFCSPLOWO2_02_FULL_42_17]